MTEQKTAREAAIQIILGIMSAFELSLKSIEEYVEESKK